MTDQKNIALAPMLGVTDFPTRYWIAMAGSPNAMTAPYIRSNAGVTDEEEIERALPELTTLSGHVPYTLTPQILGTDPEHLCRMAERLLAIAPLIELNCGCPTPSAAGPWAGSGVLREPDRMRRYIERLLAVTGPMRCAVKCRVGYQEADEWLQIKGVFKELPIKRLTIHGRTRAEGYTGRSRSELIGTASTELPYPVWLSGDVVSAAQIVDLFSCYPKLAGLIIGRGALANPFIFAQGDGRLKMTSSAVREIALVTYGLLHEAWQKKPEHLLAKIRAGRLEANCLDIIDRWRKNVGQLLAILGAPPVEPTPLTVSALLGGVTKRRLRVINGYQQNEFRSE